MGGLSVLRMPAEIVGGDGPDELEVKAKVLKHGVHEGYLPVSQRSLFCLRNCSIHRHQSSFNKKSSSYDCVVESSVVPYRKIQRRLWCFHVVA